MSGSVTLVPIIRLSPHNMDLLKNNVNIEDGSTETPSLHSDPEDMIEEITEDIGDGPKLVMDIDEEEKADTTEGKSKPNSPKHENQCEAAEDNEDAIDNSSDLVTKIKEEVDNDDAQTINDKAPNSPAQLSENEDHEEAKEQLQCSRCDKVVNHQTELVQHEKKILRGLINQNSPTSQHRQDTELGNSSYLQSGSEEDAEDRESKAGSESERKVRVQTANCKASRKRTTRTETRTAIWWQKGSNEIMENIPHSLMRPAFVLLQR